MHLLQKLVVYNKKLDAPQKSKNTAQEKTGVGETGVH
jgi:hypothetical protein